MEEKEDTVEKENKLGKDGRGLDGQGVYWQQRQAGSEPNSPPPLNGTTTQPTVPTEVPSFVVGERGRGFLVPTDQNYSVVGRPTTTESSIFTLLIHSTQTPIRILVPHVTQNAGLDI